MKCTIYAGYGPSQDRNWIVARIVYKGYGRMLTFVDIVYRTEVDRQECKNVQESLMAYPNGVRVLNHNVNPARALLCFL